MRCKPSESELSEAVALYEASGDAARVIADMGWGVLRPSVLRDCLGLAALHPSRRHEAAAGAPQQHEGEAAVVTAALSAAAGGASLTAAEFAKLVQVHLAVEHGDEAVLSVFRSLGGQPGGEGLVPAWRLVETCRFFDIPLDVHKMRELPHPAAEAAAAPAAAGAGQENARVAAGAEQQQQLSFTQVYHLLAERRKLNRVAGGGSGFNAPRRRSLTSASSSAAAVRRTPSATLVDSASVYAPPGPSEGFGVGLARYLTRGGASTPIVPRSFLRAAGGGAGAGGRGGGAAKQHRQRTLLCSASPASSVVCCSAAAADPSPPAAALPARLYRGGDGVVATETGEGYAAGERGHVVAVAGGTAAAAEEAAGGAAAGASDGEGVGRAEGGGGKGYLRVAFRGREAFVPCAHLCLSGRDEGLAGEVEAAAAAGSSPTSAAAAAVAAAASRIAAGDVVTIAQAGEGYAAGSVGAVVGHLVVLSPSSDRGSEPPPATPPPPAYSGHQRVTRPTHLLVEVSGAGGGRPGSSSCGPAMVPLEDVALLSRSEANRVLAADAASLADATASRAAAAAAASGPSATAPGGGGGGGALSRLCEVAWRRCIETSCREGDAVALAAATAPPPPRQQQQKRRPRPPPPRRHLVEAAPYLAKPCLSPPPPPQPQQARTRAGGGPPVRAVASLVHEVCQLKRQLCLAELRSAEKADRIAALERDLQRQVFRGQQRVGSAGVGGGGTGGAARARAVHSAGGGGGGGGRGGCQPKQPQKQPALLEPCYPTAPPELPGSSRNPRAGVIPSPDLIGVD